ncbi:MAG: iron transporter permease [Glaciihabitans sp.]|nr:iron transporter permease [Glaciihabitans sp.]
MTVTTAVADTSAGNPAPSPDVATSTGKRTPPPRFAVGGAPRAALVTTALAIGLAVMAILSAGIGQLHIPADEIAGSLAARVNSALAAIGLDAVRLPILAVPEHPNADATLWIVRFPRVVMAMVVGAALATAGVVMQGVFRNPLAEPGIVGVSSGAAVGASAVIVFGAAGLSPLIAPAFAFLGGLAATFVVYFAARAEGRTEVVTLVLTGIAVNAVAGAGIAFLTFAGTTQQREQIVFWQLGSLNGSRWQDVAIVLPVAAVGVLGSLLLSGRLDLLALGERQARHLGVDVERTRIIGIVVVAVLTAAAVALCGIISFVGLVIPHLMRMLLGPSHRALIPTSALGGALLLLAADLGARTAVPYAELPIGMLTAIVGGPFFFWLLRRTRVKAGGWG